MLSARRSAKTSESTQALLRLLATGRARIPLGDGVAGGRALVLQLHGGVEREAEANQHQDLLGVDVGTFCISSPASSPRPRRAGRRGPERAAHAANRHLARSIADSSWSEFRRQLTYKCQWYGNRLLVAPRFLASSKTCSRCGAVQESLSLWERMFHCPACALEIDRDLNAALNLKRWGEPQLVAGMVAGSAPETENACGGKRKTVASTAAAAREAGTERPHLVASVSQPTGMIGGPQLVSLTYGVEER